MISTLFDRFRTLGQQDADQSGSRQQRERVDEPINHAIRHIRVRRPNVSFRDETSEIASDRIPRPPEDLFQEPPIGFHGGE